MNLLNLTCLDCGQLLAQVRTPNTEQRYTSSVICPSCATKRMSERMKGNTAK